MGYMHAQGDICRTAFVFVNVRHVVCAVCADRVAEFFDRGDRIPIYMGDESPRGYPGVIGEGAAFDAGYRRIISLIGGQPS